MSSEGMSNAGRDKRKKTVTSGQVESAYVMGFASRLSQGRSGDTVAL